MWAVEDTVRDEGDARDTGARTTCFVVRLDGWPLGTFERCVGLPDEHTFGYGLAGTVRLGRRPGPDSAVLATWVANAARPARGAATITAYDAHGVAVEAWRLRDAWPLRHDSSGPVEVLQLAHTGVLRAFV